MPNEIMQHRDFDRGGSRQEIAGLIRVVSKDYQDARLHREAKDANHIEPDEVGHNRIADALRSAA
jgi:hypothetical protein